ncbi:MAG: hypothetical protein BWZ07_01157 [Alphaproteobacteria bacterium ADurb.BinA280]|nr:MAG: hypothetical protein BWZ07_01157 [Alphaproteobacteria bacterium ADurb.BinA280]
MALLRSLKYVADAINQVAHLPEALPVRDGPLAIQSQTQQFFIGEMAKFHQCGAAIEVDFL